MLKLHSPRCELETTEPLSVVAPNVLYNEHSVLKTFAPEYRRSKMADSMQKDWRELCVAVTNERDPSRLSSLVQELIEALDQGERYWRPTVCAPDAIATNQESA